MKRTGIRENLASYWFAYLGASVLSIVIATGATYIRTNLLANQKVVFFIGSYGTDVSKMSEYLNENRPQGIQSVDVSGYHVDDVYFTMYLSVKGVPESDAIILPEGHFDADYCTSYLAPLPLGYMEGIWGDGLSYYSVNEIQYGIKIYDKETKEGYFSDFIQYQKNGESPSDFYLFFAADSVHIGDLNGAKSNACIECLNLLRNYDEEN